ncbi:PEGA domain-containing protein [Thermococcus sp. 2319x1]|uniref:PEGA domain-containing protein n=1 Tax=Thermococcus sp. 2319x1 TaxID=1674923 RepID=UPI0015836378|nr:PEGA domain-containing protein [Thermococcus sp. 2319x1]
MKKAVLSAFLFLLFSNFVVGGVIEVITVPENASVYVNGEYYNQSPCNITIREEWAWTHKILTIQVNKEGYLPQNKSVFIPTTEYVQKIIFYLVTMNGTLEIVSNPAGAFVKVVGEREFNGTTPLEISLKPGNYTVTVALKDYFPNSTRVEILPNKTKTLRISLVPINGTLVITSEPVNASVYVNGTLRGMTPLNLSLRPGEYVINVTKDKSWNSTTIRVMPNRTHTVHLKIPKKGLPFVLIVGILFLLAGGGMGVYFMKLKKGGNGRFGSQKQVKIPESVFSNEAKPSIIMKSNDGRAFGISHIGRRENNEDNLLILNLPDAYLLAVADGLGGHSAGEVASQIAVDTLKEVFEREYRNGVSEEDVKEFLKKAYKLAHERIKKNAVGEKKGMGTTLVTAFVRDGKAIVANTGDSRAYLIRNGKIVARTKDHSLVQEMLDKGEITEEEARRHPMRNIITKALGIDFGVDLHGWELKPGDIILLSSDGLHDYVDEEEIVGIASQGKNAEEIARGLIEEALPVTRDNVTVVVLRV